MFNIWIFLGMWILLAVGIRLLFNRAFFDKIIGLGLLSNAVNLLLLLAGASGPHKNSLGHPAFIGATSFEEASDPLPQALILTAIVIGFAVIAFMLLYYLFAEREDS